MKIYMFRTVPVSIVSSFSLHTHQWYMSYRFADRAVYSQHYAQLTVYVVILTLNL